MRAPRHCHVDHSSGHSAGAAAPPITSRSRHRVLAGSPGAADTAIWWSHTSSDASGPVNGMPLSRRIRTGPCASCVTRSLTWMSCRPSGTAPARLSCTGTSAPASSEVGSDAESGSSSRSGP